MKYPLSEPQRKAAFWLVCLPLRTAIARYAAAAPLLSRPFAAVIGTRWLLGLENGDEGMFGGPTWWADQRQLHGGLWSAYAVTGQSCYLWADVAVGAANWARVKLG
jgi:hypothetical protein